MKKAHNKKIGKRRLIGVGYKCELIECSRQGFAVQSLVMACRFTHNKLTENKGNYQADHHRALRTGWGLHECSLRKAGCLPIEEDSPRSIGEGGEGVLVTSRTTTGRGVEQ